MTHATLFMLSITWPCGLAMLWVGTARKLGPLANNKEHDAKFTPQDPKGRRTDGNRSLMASALVPLGMTGATAMPQTPEGPTSTISSQELKVTVSRDFPQVLKYTEAATSASIDGSTAPIKAIKVNGETHQVEVTSTPAGDAAMDYRITVPGIPGAVIEARISVEDSVMTFRVTGITDGTATKIRTLGIPGEQPGQSPRPAPAHRSPRRTSPWTARSPATPERHRSPP